MVALILDFLIKICSNEAIQTNNQHVDPTLSNILLGSFEHYEADYMAESFQPDPSFILVSRAEISSWAKDKIQLGHVHQAIT
jgi:hypothetical protein